MTVYSDVPKLLKCTGLTVDRLFYKYVKILSRWRYIVHTYGYHFLHKLQANFFFGQTMQK